MRSSRFLKTVIRKQIAPPGDPDEHVLIILDHALPNVQLPATIGELGWC